MEAKDTRKQILDIALRQFSNRGFLAVSIRDICKEVGVKESTIYYHFKNKQDILDSLIKEFSETITVMNDSLAVSFEGTVPTEIEDSDFLRVGKLYYTQFLNDERVLMFIGMLMIEQRNNPDFGKLLAKFMFEQPIEIQSRYFSLLIKWGYLKDVPVIDLAVAYQSIFYFCFSRQIALGQSVQSAEADLERHLSFFLRQYKEERK